MRLTPAEIGRIKACQGVYSVGDTARHLGVSKSTVHDVWAGKRHMQVPAAPEPDNVPTARVPGWAVAEDARVLLERGMSVAETARKLGVCPNTIYKYGGRACSLYVG